MSSEAFNRRSNENLPMGEARIVFSALALLPLQPVDGQRHHDSLPSLITLLQLVRFSNLTHYGKIGNSCCIIVVAAFATFLPDNSSLKQNVDLFYVLWIKRALQALWGLGVLGSCYNLLRPAQPTNNNLIQYILHNPSAKLDFSRILLLGHLTGLMDDGIQLILVASWMTLFVVFAGRKFTQLINDDIDDKSVFMFNSLRDDEKKALLEKLQQQKTQN
ncbi:hypothetical protein CR513_17569, partial [Mucuna pruriens]